MPQAISRLLLLFAVLISSNACRAEPPATPTPERAEIKNYGAWQPLWLDKLQRLNRGENTQFRILQIGDSHTAGDYFTDALRESLQQRWGNAGIGWVYPNTVAGQRNAQILHHNQGWKVLSSRSDRADFPLGGIISRSSTGGRVTLNPRRPTEGAQRITLTARPVFANNPLTITDGSAQTIAHLPNLGESKWQQFNFTSTLPVSYRAEDGDIWEIGHINIENGQAGVIVSAMGINGSQLSQWQQWHNDWVANLSATQADLVILAYGTNEAFNNNIDIAQTQAIWSQTIQRIREALPGAGILIIGAPESLRVRRGQCGTRPARLDEVQAMQREIAQQQQVMYWSWQAAMGGECSMTNWMAQGLGARDGIHFTARGYRQAAEVLANDLQNLVQNGIPRP